MNTDHPQYEEDSIETLFREVSRRAQAEGIGSYDEYRDLVEGLLQEKLNEGVFDADEDLPTMEKDLERMWPRLEPRL